MIRINFVCLGNICRSPFAEALAREEVARCGWSHSVQVDSSGTSNEHEGERSHPLSIAVGESLGLQMTHRARQFQAEEFEDWDYILAMDQSNQRHLLSLAPDSDAREKISLLLSWDPEAPVRDVPDPWGYGEDAYERMAGLIRGALGPFLGHLQRRHKL